MPVVAVWRRAAGAAAGPAVAVSNNVHSCPQVNEFKFKKEKSLRRKPQLFSF